MDEFKKSVFGGYHKVEVKAKLWDLERRAAKAEADLEKATADCEDLQKTAEELRQQLTSCEERNAVLQSDLERSKSSSASDHIIGKVYRHAYETGAEITKTARDDANKFLTQVNGIYEQNQTEISQQTEALLNAGTEISNLIEQINSQTRKLQAILNDFNQKVLAMPSAYNGVNGVLSETAKRIDDAVAAYEASSQEFAELISEQPSAEPQNTETVADEAPTDLPQAQLETAEAPAPQESEADVAVPDAVAQAQELVARATEVVESLGTEN
ncbi:MAG: hypothetical protein MJ132_03120 [Clostridia bacterium]|nr:hypothetical protein [Clostridia bacterium]